MGGGDLGDTVVLLDGKLVCLSEKDYYKHDPTASITLVGVIYIPISDNVYSTLEVGVLPLMEGPLDESGVDVLVSYASPLLFTTETAIDSSLISPIEDLLNDFKGREHTLKILNSILDESWKTDTSVNTPYPAFTACWRYKPAGTKNGDWHLPSTGECKYIIDILNTMGGEITPMLVDNLTPACTSTVDNAETLWHTMTANKSITSNLTEAYCIPVMRAKVLKDTTQISDYFCMTAVISGENAGWEGYDYLGRSEIGRTILHDGNYHVYKTYDPEPELDDNVWTFGTQLHCLSGDCSPYLYVTGDIKVVIEKGRPKSLRRLFDSSYTITSIDMDFGDCSLLTDITEIFYTLDTVKSLTVRNLDTSHLTNITNSFRVNRWSEDSTTHTSLETLSCSQEVKDWCLANAETIGLPAAFRDSNYSGWKII